jgi:hypothetical protein
MLFLKIHEICKLHNLYRLASYGRKFMRNDLYSSCRAVRHFQIQLSKFNIWSDENHQKFIQCNQPPGQHS